MRFAALALLFSTFLALSAYSLDIVAPSELPEGSSFAVVTSIQESNFDEIRVFLNNTTVFSQGLGEQANLQYIAAYTRYNPNADKKLVVVFNPLSSGEYTIKVQLLKNSSVESEKNISVTVFKSLKSTALEPMRQEINSIKEEMKGLRESIESLSEKLESVSEQISSIERNVSSLSTAIEDQNKGIEESKAQYGAVLASVSEIKNGLRTYVTALSEIKAKQRDVNAALSAISDRLSNLEQDQAKSNVSFITVGQSALIASGSILLIIVIIIIAIAIMRKRSKAPLFEFGEIEKRKEEPSEILDNVMESAEIKGGRWAYKGESEKEPKEEKRFSLGDLIKRAQ